MTRGQRKELFLMFQRLRELPTRKEQLKAAADWLELRGKYEKNLAFTYIANLLHGGKPAGTGRPERALEVARYLDTLFQLNHDYRLGKKRDEMLAEAAHHFNIDFEQVRKYVRIVRKYYRETEGANCVSWFLKTRGRPDLQKID